MNVTLRAGRGEKSNAIQFVMACKVTAAKRKKEKRTNNKVNNTKRKRKEKWQNEIPVFLCDFSQEPKWALIELREIEN